MSLSRPQYWVKDDAGILWRPGMEKGKSYFSDTQYPAHCWVSLDGGTQEEITVRGMVLPASIVVFRWEVEEGHMGVMHIRKGSHDPK